MSDENDWDYLFTWHIEDFSFCNREPGVKLMSPTFSVEALNNTKWYLSIYPGGYRKKYKEYASCFLNKSEDNEDVGLSVIDYKIQIILDEKVLDSDIEYGWEFSNGEADGFYEFFERNVLLAKMKKCNTNTLTLHCYIKKYRGIKHSIKKSESRTLILTDKCSFAWNVKFMDNIFMKEKRYFCLNDTFYQITIGTEQDDVTLIIQKIFENGSKSYPITGKISLLDIKGSKILMKEDIYSYDSDIWDFPPFLTKGQLLDNAKEGTIDLYCEFNMSTKSEMKTKATVNSNPTAYSDALNLTNLSSDLRNLFIDKSNSDVKLRVNSDIELQAHKIILAARSPVFAAMFKQEMLENRTGIINLEDVDAAILDLFLKFLYTGVVDDLSRETATKLLMLADKYEVLSLKEMCAFYLMSVLCVENVLEILSLADMVYHKALKTHALEFAAKHSAEVFAAPELQNWVKSNPNLSAEIMAYLGKNSKFLPKIS